MALKIRMQGSILKIVSVPKDGEARTIVAERSSEPKRVGCRWEQFSTSKIESRKGRRKPAHSSEDI